MAKSKKSRKKVQGTQRSHKKRNSDKSRGKWIAGCTAAAALFAVVYIGGAFYYKDRFFKGTQINQVACGNLKAEDAEKRIREKAENYSIEILFKEDKKEKAAGKDFLYEYVPDGQIEELLNRQNCLLWVKGLFQGEKLQIEENITFDEAKLREKLETFDSMKEENMTPPTDAHIAFENNQFVIKEETTGTAINKDLFFEKVKEAVDKGEKKLSAEEAGAYTLPAVKKEDPNLQHQKEVWNSCAAVTVTYTFGDKKEVLDGMTVKDWMTYDEAGNYVDNPAVLQENIRQYVLGLAEKYNTVGRTRTITSTATGQPVDVEGGSYGFRIDQEGERAQLLADVQSHAVTEREPVYARRANAYADNDIGNTYLEIDLSAQHLWYYRDGAMILESDFVSGTYYNRGRRTPGGTYSLAYKQRNQVLRPAPNPDGSYAYESPVSYWMPFNGGIGLHDANWRGRFGGNIYLYSGSHGCINLPVSFAGQLYENLEAGCPIVCFYR